MVLFSDKKAGKRWKEHEELAKRAAYKGNIKEAIDNYADAIYFLENDYPNLRGKDEEARKSTVARLQGELEGLRQKEQPLQ